MSDLVRVRSKTTGHRFTTLFVSDNMVVLDEPAVDSMGRPLPAEPNTDEDKPRRRKASRADKPSGDSTEGNEE